MAGVRSRPTARGRRPAPAGSPGPVHVDVEHDHRVGSCAIDGVDDDSIELVLVEDRSANLGLVAVGHAVAAARIWIEAHRVECRSSRRSRSCCSAAVSSAGTCDAAAMADNERIAVERDAGLDGLVTITLDRADKLNALDVAMHDELQAALTELETDPAGEGGHPHRCRPRLLLWRGAGLAARRSGDQRRRSPGACAPGRPHLRADRPVAPGRHRRGQRARGRGWRRAAHVLRPPGGGELGLVLDPRGGARPPAHLAGPPPADARARAGPHQGAGDALRALHGRAGVDLGVGQPGRPRR